MLSCMWIIHIKEPVLLIRKSSLCVGTGFLSRYGNGPLPYNRVKNVLIATGPDGAVAMSLANGLVGTGFASRYRPQPRAGF